MSEIASVDISARKQQFYFSDLDRTDDLKELRAAYLYHLGRRLDFETSISRTLLTSTDAVVEYESNTLMCSLTMQF